MNRDRFSFETIAYLVVGVVFLWIFVTYFSAAFPSASIQLEVTRAEAGEVARTFLEERGHDLDAYKDAVVFDANGAGAVFLQQTVGMEEANRLMASEAPIWRWTCRWFQSAEKEAFRVFVAPSGRVLRYQHEIEEDRDGPEIELAAAETLAVAFLTDVMQFDLAGFERVEASTKRQANRTDHHFEWKQTGSEIAWKDDDPEAGAGTIRIQADVRGDEVGHAAIFFKTPEAFDREYERITSHGTLLAIISLVFLFLTTVAALVVFIVKYKQDAVPWRFALVFALIVTVGFILFYLNQFPVLKTAYDTAIDYSVFVGLIVAVAFFVAVIYGMFILFTGASGAALTREIWPHSVAVIDRLRQGKVFTRAFFFASLRGYALAFFFLGYVTLFYLVARNYFDVFVLAEGPYSNLLGTYLPWIAPLTISLLAAVSEEFSSRLFSISFLKKYLKWTPIALLIPAVIWAFGHSTYPVFPVYVRGIELTIGGVIFGLFFLRFNIMTCIIAHYVIDAILFALPLLNSGNPTYVFMGWVVCLLAAVPMVVGIPGLLKKETG